MKQFLVLFLVMLTGCSMAQQTTPGTTSTPDAHEEGSMFTLTSSAFQENGNIADRYTYNMGSQCSGENYSPPLSWSGAPDGTKGYALVVLDPDGGDWVHWLLTNIPADITSLEEHINGPAIGVSGRNSFGSDEYGGPCPPSGTHRYIFTLYALDTMLKVGHGATWREVSSQLTGHILAETQLTGLRSAK